MGLEPMLRDQTLLDDAAGDEMFLNDPFQHGRIALTVPCAFGIDDGDRSAFTDAQTVRLRAENAALLRQSELLEPPFQEVPRGKPAIFLAALGLGLIATQKNMPARNGHADARCDRPL